jgi:hypothetical protein
MTHWVMGSKKNLKVGALVSVTGTLTHSTIAAAKFSALQLLMPPAVW